MDCGPRSVTIESPWPRPTTSTVELSFLEAELKRLEAEYNMFFAGRLPRPPWETRRRVEALVKQLDRTHIANYGRRFRFTTLQSRFATFVDLWDRGLRAREEGRAGSVRAAAAVVERAQAGTARGSRPARHDVRRSAARDGEAARALRRAWLEARREAGQEAIPFHKFADLVKTQVKSLKEKGSQRWRSAWR